MTLQDLKEGVAAIKSAVETIESEITIAENKNVFAYPRSKNIRREALDIAKHSKDIREICLMLFKEGEEK